MCHASSSIQLRHCQGCRVLRMTIANFLNSLSGFLTFFSLSLKHLAERHLKPQCIFLPSDSLLSFLFFYSKWQVVCDQLWCTTLMCNWTPQGNKWGRYCYMKNCAVPLIDTSANKLVNAPLDGSQATCIVMALFPMTSA